MDTIKPALATGMAFSSRGKSATVVPELTSEHISQETLLSNGLPCCVCLYKHCASITSESMHCTTMRFPRRLPNIGEMPQKFASALQHERPHVQMRNT